MGYCGSPRWHGQGTSWQTTTRESDALRNRKNEGTGKPVLAARIGLETGPAVLDAAGEIYGDVANVAARVQALAEPGAVLVTARVQRQVAGRVNPHASTIAYRVTFLRLSRQPIA